MCYVTTKIFGGLATYGCEAEVTMCPMGVDGYHIHTTYREITARRDAAGICGTVATIEEAESLYERAVESARQWFAANRVD